MPFTPAERRLIARLRTPAQVQAWLNKLPYNAEISGETIRSFRQVMRHRTAHCLEAALFAATVLEQHGYPPLLLELGSADGLDHVLFLYRRNGKWGSVAQSRDPALHGRKAMFRTLRSLALSYFDGYVDDTGSLTGFAPGDLRDLGDFDWRFAKSNVWKVERYLLALKQTKIPRRPERVKALRKKYQAYRKRTGRKPIYYSGRETWLPIPKGFR